MTIVERAHHPSAILAELYVEGMRPYWDWYIAERGGAREASGGLRREAAGSLDAFAFAD